MTIDWDRIADEADESPRAVLARWLAEADGITTLIVIAEREASGPDDHPLTRQVAYESSGTGMSVLGLLTYAHDSLRDLQRRAD